MHKFFGIIVLLFGCVLLAGTAIADSFHLTDGTTVTGEMVSFDDNGVIFKLEDGSYGDRVPWAKFGQEDLKQIVQNPKAAQFVEPFIEPSQEDKLKKTEVDIKTDYSKLPRPAKQSLIGAMFSSSMGLALIVIMYAANIYAGYEISVYRARPAALVCGVSAVAPVLGPIIFLALPPETKKKTQDWVNTEEEVPVEALKETGGARSIVSTPPPAPLVPSPGLPQEPEVPQETLGRPATTAAGKTTTSQMPGAKTYLRGQFTFNRRFFETQLPGFFAMTRPDADKNKVLIIKSSRGNFEAKRIPRISATDVNLQVQKGAASEEVTVQFVEIQEIQVKVKEG